MSYIPSTRTNDPLNCLPFIKKPLYSHVRRNFSYPQHSMSFQSHININVFVHKYKCIRTSVIKERNLKSPISATIKSKGNQAKKEGKSLNKHLTSNPSEFKDKWNIKDITQHTKQRMNGSNQRQNIVDLSITLINISTVPARTPLDWNSTKK